MLNDAASGRFRGMNFGRPYNPFDQMIADLENKRRAQWAQRSQDQQEAVQRAKDAEAEERYQQQVRAAAERRRAALRAQAAREERRRQVAELERQVADGDAAASLDLGVLAEGNHLEPGLLALPSGMDARSFARSQYEKADHWGHDLGLVALACSTAGETPDFAALRDTVATLPNEVRRREHLQGLASRGHVGAKLWLGAWHSGRFVGLGIPPEPGKNADDVRRAIGYLDRARKANWELAGAWYAEAVLSGSPKPGERAEAMSILERLVETGLAKHPAAAPALTYEWLRDLELSNRAGTRMNAREAWITVEARYLFTSRMAPVETWLALQCVRLAHERGVAPDAGPFIPEIRALSPKDAPTKGAALLARMYFTRIHTRDVSMRSGVATVYAALVKAAWRDPSLWAQVAALVEAVQIEPLTPDEWVKRAQGRLADRNSALRWMEVAEAAQIWRIGQPYWEPGSAEWLEAARTLGEVAVAALGTDLPAGRSWNELNPMYDVGIEGGHGPSFVQRVTQLQMDVDSKDPVERTELRDKVIVDLSKKLLERDPANVFFLEETARPRLRDEALWNILMWEMGHHQDKHGTPSAVLEFVRKSAPADTTGKQAAFVARVGIEIGIGIGIEK